MVIMSTCIHSTRGSNVLSSTGDMLVKNVDGVYDMCICLWLGAVWMERGVSG